MKIGSTIAVASDFHGNATATKTFLSIIKERNVDKLICLGDYVSDYPLPQDTLRALAEIRETMSCIFIRGNREEYFLSDHEEWKPSARYGSLYHTKKHLTAADLQWFASLPKAMDVVLPKAGGFTIAHGSPTDSCEHVYPNAERTKQFLKQCKHHILIVGHTHQPIIASHKEGCLINPGSIGSPINGKPQGQFATLQYNGERWIPKLHTFSYVIKDEQQRFFTSAFFQEAHEWAIASYLNLSSAKGEHLRLLDEVHKLAHGGLYTEEMFHTAAKNLHFPDWQTITSLI